MSPFFGYGLDRPQGSQSSNRPKLPALPDAAERALLHIEESGHEAIAWDRGFSLLHWAARSGPAPLVEYLLDLGMSPLTKDEEGRTALECAVEKNRTHIGAIFRSRMVSDPRQRRALRHKLLGRDSDTESEDSPRHSRSASPPRRLPLPEAPAIVAQLAKRGDAKPKRRIRPKPIHVVPPTKGRQGPFRT